MTGLEVGLAVAAGLVGGVLNTAAAGGAVAAFMVVVLSGVSPIAANVANLMATPAGFAAAVVLDRLTRARRRAATTAGPASGGSVAVAVAPMPERPRVQLQRSVLVAATLGSAAGAALVRLMGEATFRHVAPALLVLAAALLAVQPLIRRLGGPRDDEGASAPQAPAARRALPLVIAVTSVYAGLFGGGVAALVMCAVAWLTTWTWSEVAGAKDRVCLVTSVAGAVVLAFSGPVAWALAGWLALGMFAGGLVGRVLVKRLRGSVLRSAVIVTSVGAAVFMTLA